MRIKRINRETNNPYLLSYLSFALICVLSLSLAFLLISTKVSRDEQAIRDEAKLELISENLHQQLSFMRKVEMEVAGNTVYYPKYFSEYKYFEIEVLNNFEQYLSRLSAVDEILLYYGDDRLFRGSGSISDFDVFFQKLSSSEKEEIRKWMDSASWQGVSFMKAGNIYIGIPLKTISGYGGAPAKLCFEIKEETFAEYLDMLGGISNGKFCLYHGGACLYSNTDEDLSPDTEDKGKIVTQDRIYNLTLVFMPDNGFVFGGNYAILSVSLILAIVIWIVMMAYLFAGKTYKPVKRFVDTYRGRMGYAEHTAFGNDLEEMGDAIENLLAQHQNVRAQLDQEEENLKEVVLRTLLKGDHADSIRKYMEYVRIDLSGNFFCVYSVFFEEKKLETEFTNSARELFEKRIRDYLKKDSVYVLSRKDPREMNIICCLWERDDSAAAIEAIRKASEVFCSDPLIGCGGIYNNLTKLSASCLESLDRLNRLTEERNRKNDLACGTEIDSKLTMQFFFYLREGEEKKALEELWHIITEMENRNMSFLFQQYVLAEFMHNISDTAKICNIRLSTQPLSLMVSSKGLKEFGEAVELVVHELCEGLRIQRREIEVDQSKEIVDYISRHFMEYDISMESVSKVLGVKPDVVRGSIMRHFGKNYKEYVLSLRMEEAKRLLTEECLSVEETSRMLGYANASYFIKLFKKAYGVTPAEYKSVKGTAK